MNILRQSQIKSIVKIALEAGEVAMSYFGDNNLKVLSKSDNSPLTIADSLISDLIYHGLTKIIPEIPIICEEGKNRDFGDGVFWLIDPIDGTSSFATNDSEFTINIALIKNKKPIFGLIFAPAIAGLPFYYTDENQKLIRYFVDSKKEEIFISQKSQKKVTQNFIVIASKRSLDQEILDYVQKSTHQSDWTTLKVSSSLKFIYLIEGKADLYVHLRRSMEWDIAAGEALLRAAGGEIMNLDGSEFLYEKTDLVNQPFLARID